MFADFSLCSNDNTKRNEKILFEWPREYNSNLLLFDIYIAIFFQLSIP